MADIALVPESDIFEGRDCVAAQNAGQSAQPFACDRIALVRHGTRALLALRKEFLSLKHLRALKMPELGRPPFNARACQGQSADKFRVQIPLDHLSRDWRGTQPQLLAYRRL